MNRLQSPAWTISAIQYEPSECDQSCRRESAFVIPSEARDLLFRSAQANGLPLFLKCSADFYKHLTSMSPVVFVLQILQPRYVIAQHRPVAFRQPIVIR